MVVLRFVLFQIDLTTVQAIRIAVGNGLTMLSECYEKVTLDLANDDDSDDEGSAGQKSIVYRSKNPHEDRPLPHLIGSKAWNEKWHIGLYDSDDDLSQDGDAGDGDDYSPSSDAESLSLSVSTTSIAPTVTDSDYSVQASRSSQQTQPYHIGTKQPMSVTNEIIPRVPVMHTPVAVLTHRQKATNLFDESDSSEAEEQLRKTGQPHTQIISKSEPPPETSMFRTQKPAQSVTVAANLFDDEPPEIEFPVKNDRKPINLFVDTDDEDDETFQPQKLMSNQVPTAVPVAAPRISHKKSVNIFDDGDDDDFLKSTAMPPTKKSNISNLFDDSPPDDLFDVLIQKQPKVAVTAQTLLDKGLFDDFENDADFAIVPSTKLTLPNTDINPSSTKPALRTSIFDDFDDDNDDFEKLIASTNKLKPFEVEATNNKVVKSIPKDLSSAPVKSSIFDDFEDGNDEFIATNEQKPYVLVPKDLEPLQPTATTKTITNEATKGKILGILFDGKIPDDDYDEIFEKPKVQSKSKSSELFDDDTIPTIDILSQPNNDRSFAEITDNIDNNIHSESTTTTLKSGDNDIVAVARSYDLNRAPVANSQLEVINSEEHVIKSLGIVTEIAQNEPENIRAPIVNTALNANRSNVFSFLDNEPPSIENDLFSNSSYKRPELNAASSLTPTPLMSVDIPPDDRQAHQIPTNELPKESLKKPSSDDEVDIKVDDTKPNLSTTLGLFDDFPPEDDFLFISESTNIEKSGQSIGLFDDLPSDDDYMSSANSTSVLAINQPNTAANVSLFNDLPPDDDIFENNMSPTISTTNIYYDDFADTIISVNDSYANTDDIFSEKPPMDNHPEPSPDMDQLDPSPDMDQLDRAVIFTDKLSKFTQPLENSKKIEDVTLPKPKKLNDKFNINVAALLPGAKRPSFKATSTYIENEVTEPKFPPFTTSPTTTNSAADSSSRLIGLNKSRAKIQVQRRPSTRKARQNEYRKSLIAIDIDEDSITSNSNPPKVNKSATTASSTVIQASIEDMFKNASPDDWLVPPAPQPQTPPMIDEEPHKSGQKTINKDNDWLFCAPKQVPKPRIESIDGKEDSFSEVLSDKKNVSLFGDESEEDDWLAKSITSAPRLSSVKSKQTAPIAKSLPVVDVKQASLFSDYEDEDDLFAPLAKHIVSETPKLSAINVPSVKSPNVGGGDGDGIATSKQNLRFAASSLFGDDDDDDDLFGGNSRQSVGPSKPHRIVPPIKATAQISSKVGLFGDSDEDDDDIFFSSKSKRMCKI